MSDVIVRNITLAHDDNSIHLMLILLRNLTMPLTLMTLSLSFHYFLGFPCDQVLVFDLHPGDIFKCKVNFVCFLIFSKIMSLTMLYFLVWKAICGGSFRCKSVLDWIGDCELRRMKSIYCHQQLLWCEAKSILSYHKNQRVAGVYWMTIPVILTCCLSSSNQF